MACAASVLASCNKNTQTPSDTPQHQDKPLSLIRFGVGDIETRSFAESGNNDIKSNGFMVACVTDDNSVMFNEAATWDQDNSHYKTAANYYWAKTGTLHFYAVYPKTQEISISQDGKATLSYQADHDLDLLAAKGQGSFPESDDYKQSLPFSHILGQLALTAKGDTPSLKYKITEVSVDAPASGTFAYDDFTWERDNNSSNTFYRGDKVVGNSYAEFQGYNMSFIPGDVTINISYTVYDALGKTVLGQYAKKATTALTAGKLTTINATLPFDDASPILFTVTVSAWESESAEISFEEDIE